MKVCLNPFFSWGIIVLSVSISLLASADESSCSSRDVESCACQGIDLAKSWTDEVGDKFHQFLQEKIFGQKDLKGNSGRGFLTDVLQDHGKDKGEENKDTGGDNPVLNFLSRFTESNKNQAFDDDPFRSLMDRLSGIGANGVDQSKNVDTGPRAESSVISLLERVKNMDEDDHSLIGTDFLRLIQDTATKALEQLKGTFGNILEDIDASIAIAIIYYLTYEDAKRNPSWKRRQHRFCKPVSKAMVIEMHDALYLSQLSYVNSIDDFKEGLKKFQNNEWEVAYGTTDSLPKLPAHFLLIHKDISPLADPALLSIFPWERKRESELTATLVIRGTKDLSDALADALLEPAEYRGGFAHGGILDSGKNLAKKYLPKLQALLKHSGHDKIKLYLVGHSLGAGAAAIAAMEFNDHDWIKVKSIGFGCPSLLSRELSEATKKYVTTVVADSDIIPRMSGASIVNLLLNLIEFDWTDMALEDINFTVDRAASTFSLSSFLPRKEVVLEWAKTYIEREVKPKLRNEERTRMSSLLIPPGDCIHFYRDGVGYSSVYTPCSFFDNIELSRTLVDDHLIVPGYHRALVSIVRDWEKNHNVRMRGAWIQLFLTCPNTAYFCLRH